MLNKQLKLMGAGAVIMAYSCVALGHGFIDSPGARNYFCGAVTKPDEVDNGTAEYPVCGDAFANDFNGGYQFMSVLNHHEGRKVLGPVTKNVCGFDSETWKGGRTPWDEPINWPVNNISSGPLTFSWDISNGPHFSDTADFRYWITKPGFEYQVGQDLQWSDFEDQPFCDLNYNYANQAASPNIQADEGSAHFYTTCNVPARSGRHVIYAEWGRTPPTYERFHGCVDVQFGGSTASSSSTASSTSSSSVSVSSSSMSSVVSSSSSSSSVAGQCTEACQWYGDASLYPLCTNQDSGWGWESNRSCIGRTTCASRNNTGGVVSTCGASSTPVSSSASSVISSSVSSSSSSSAMSSSSSSSSTATAATCNWFGWQVAICKNTSGGWGNENGQTCVSQATCNSI